ncbi:hypothetical protein Y600_5528 [Burkholderia pseudomallei MSHR3709]|nr:hypothetical protein DO63_5023 [Burkholderia pseudomallei]KGX47543.1 hypothetical protein Y600_5528 [Burkholderia pseudomallei MSHR3709]
MVDFNVVGIASGCQYLVFCRHHAIAFKEVKPISRRTNA